MAITRITSKVKYYFIYYIHLSNYTSNAGNFKRFTRAHTTSVILIAYTIFTK